MSDEHDSRLTQLGASVDGLARNVIELSSLVRGAIAEMKRQRGEQHGHLDRIYTRLGELHELMMSVRMDTANNAIVLAERLPVIETRIEDLTKAVDSLGSTQRRIESITPEEKQRAAGDKS